VIASGLEAFDLIALLRKWLKKGKSQGFVTVPFSSALGTFGSKWQN